MKSQGLILWGPSMYVNYFMAVEPVVVIAILSFALSTAY